MPAALLLAVGLTQIVLTFTTGLTPWKGGGFGMFAAYVTAWLLVLAGSELPWASWLAATLGRP